jgi:hypothetical protein
LKNQPGAVAPASPTDPNAAGRLPEDEHDAFASLDLGGSERQRADRPAAFKDVVASTLGSAPHARHDDERAEM